MRLGIIFLVVVLFLLSGCTITGRVVNEISSDVQSQLEKDYKMMVDAVEEKDVTKCYYIMTQDVREDCFMRVAKVTNDIGVCNNLLSPHPRDGCLDQLN